MVDIGSAPQFIISLVLECWDISSIRLYFPLAIQAYGPISARPVTAKLSMPLKEYCVMLVFGIILGCHSLIEQFVLPSSGIPPGTF